MRGLRSKLGAISNPLIVVEWIIVLVTLVGTLWLFFPLFSGVEFVQSNSPIISIIASFLGILALAVVALGSNLLLIAGIVKRKAKWRSAALFTLGLLRLYAVLAGILINGLLPLTWLSSFGLMLICFYIWGRIRKRGVE